MAERRMFAKSVIESDAFLDMPISARLLYFDLGMRGDDDGFVDSPKRIMRITGASEDDLKLLIAKQFLIPFEIGVVVVRHWKMHNYIRNDRYKPTQYQFEKTVLTEDTNGIYSLRLTDGIPNDNQVATACLPDGCIGEVNRGKENIGEREEEHAAIASAPAPYDEIVNLYNSICGSFPKVKRLSNDRRKAIKARLNDYGLDDFRQLFTIAESTPFLKGKNPRNWAATFDWLISDKNMAKVLDGNYGDNSPATSSAHGADGTTHPDGGVWMNGKQVLGV